MIKIPVGATLDTKQIEANIQTLQTKLNSLGKQIAQANKAPFTPVSKTSVADIQKITQQFEQLRKISGDLNKRINATGQKGAGFFDLDWGKMYPDQASRQRQLAKAFHYVTAGTAMHAAAPMPAGGAGGRAGPGGFTQMAVNAVQAGLRAGNNATGGVSGVGANALGTGMSSGFGAGLMGLMGGMLALGVGKLVSAATEKIEDARDNEVAYDRLKRTLGDVNVSFNALKSSIQSGAQNLKLTFSETTKLGTEFAKLGNLTADQSKSLFMPGGEISTSVGLARSFGLDPSQTTGILGQLRGSGLTKNDADTRRFALLIGETIGKSGAFAKADEVMEALSNYANSQVRNNLGTVNTAGYAGLFSSMIGSGIPGLDPAGAGSLIARVNASIMGGGAKGEASQFFTGMVGRRLGPAPIQTQMMREGGAFSTKDSTFGPGSIWSRFMGGAGPAGGQTMLEAQLGALRGQYGSNKGLLAQATANHLGVNMAQAMALHLIKPNQMGEMQKYGDLTKLSGSGIGNLTKALYGSDADRQALAESLRGRTGADALTAAERSALDRGMGGTTEDQRKVLAELVAKRDQESTQGSDIRDTRNIMDNLKTLMAEKLIPLTQEIRHGIMYIAGHDGKISSSEIMKSVMEADHAQKRGAIDNDFLAKRKGINDQRAALRSKMDDLSDEKLQERYRGQPEMIKQKLEERRKLSEDFAATEKRLIELQEEKARLIMQENKRHQKALDDAKRAEMEAIQSEANPPVPGAVPGGVGGASGGRSGGAATYSTGYLPKGLGPLSKDEALKAQVAANEREIGVTPGLLWAQIEQESKFWPNAKSPTGVKGLTQFTKGTTRHMSRKFGRTFDRENVQDAIFMQKEYMRELIQQYGSEDAALRAYNGGGDPYYARKIRGIMERNRNMEGTPLPKAVSSSGREDGMRVHFDNLEIIHRNERGQQIGSQQLSARVSPATPFGMSSYA